MEETRNAPYCNEEDRFSRLPDELIHSILSFIDTKYAVQTCVLSKRWIHVWKTLPFLKFSRNSFSEHKKQSFVMFVDMVFILRCKDSDILKLCVHWNKSAYDDSVMMNVNRWIVHAVTYNVQDISIVITECHDSAYEIPHHLLNCKSLKKLVLKMFGNGRYADVTLPNSMSLPRLKVLYLIGLSISNAKRLFSSCPNLKELHITDCDIQTDNQRNLIVDSPRLKKFEYAYSNKKLLLRKDTMANVIKLCAPNLATFIFRPFFMQDYSLENFSPLSTVRLYMRLKTKEEHENAERYSKVPPEEKQVYAIRTLKYLGVVDKVRTMVLSSGFLEVLSQAPDLLDCQLPRLCNLQSLKLDMWFTRGCLRAIAYLLKISPNITKLILTSKESNFGDVGDDWEAGLSSPGMLSQLHYVRVKGVEGCDNEMKFLSFMMKNAMVLRQVVLYPRSTTASPGNVMRRYFKYKLRALPRASSCIRMCWPATCISHLL